MTSQELNKALQTYEEALTKLEHDSPNQNEAKAKVLALLNARDKIALLLEEGHQAEADWQMKLIDSDLKLKEKAASLAKIVDWENYRSSLKAKDLKSWWWYLEQEVPVHVWDRLDWLWRMLTVGCWTANLGLLVDIVPRFLMAGTGWLGAATVTFPSLMTLLQARSELTIAGRESFDNLLKRLNIPQHYQQEAKLGTTLLLFALLIGLRLNLPHFSNYYNRAGLDLHRQNKLAGAESKYRQALALDPDNINAHYNLGDLYEDLQQFDQARKQYQFAVRGNLLKAQNNLGRLYILNEEPEKAIPLLVNALSQTRDAPTRLRHNVLKNLGWAFLAHKQPEYASKYLQVAVQLGTTAEGIEQIPYRGSAHCLLAQSYQQQQKSAEALNQWQQCCKLGSINNSDEVLWLSTARKKLTKEGINSCSGNAVKP